MSSGDLLIRPSRDDDVAAITAIYAHHVLHDIASFEEAPPAVEEMARRRAALVERDFPYLIAERSGKVVGYSYSGPYRARIGYRFSRSSILDVFVDGTLGPKPIGNTIHFGTGYRYSF